MVSLLVGGTVTIGLASLALVLALRLGRPWFVAPGFLDTHQTPEEFLRPRGNGMIVAIGIMGAGLIWVALTSVLDVADSIGAVAAGLVEGLAAGAAALGIYAALRWAAIHRTEDPGDRVRRARVALLWMSVALGVSGDGTG